jgi:hypothetical protein
LHSFLYTRLFCLFYPSSSLLLFYYSLIFLSTTGGKVQLNVTWGDSFTGYLGEGGTPGQGEVTDRMVFNNEGAGEQRRRRVGYYLQRWKLEGFHEVLTSGCGSGV